MNKKKIILCTILIGTVLLTVSYFSALLIIPNVIDLNKYKETVAQEIENQTGYKVSCENISFKKGLTPYLKINMFHTIVLYPDNNVFLKLKDINLKVKILPLIFKKISIKDAQFTRPIINITIYKDFSTSIEKYINPERSINTNGFKMNSIIANTVLKNYKININDESINKNLYIEGDNLLLKNIKIGENAHIITTGALYEGNKEFLKYDIDLKTILTNNKKMFSFSPFKPIIEYNVNGDIKGHIDILKNNYINGIININNLTINLENTLLENNNIFLDFKGEEVNINSEIHTSKNDIAQLKGHFNFGKKKHIELITKAQNINLNNLYKIISVISDSLNIKNNFKDIKIQGLANADFKLYSDFKKLSSSGHSKIINTKITHKELPYKIEKINSDINFDNNKILIENANFLINSTPVKLSGIINEDVSVKLQAESENLDLKTITDIFIKSQNMPINIIGGKVSFNSTITGKLNKTLKSENNIILKNVKLKEKSKQIPITTKLIELQLNTNNKFYTGNIKLSDVFLDKNSITPFPIEAKELSLSFDNKQITIPENNLTIPSNSSIHINGNIKNYTNNPEINIKYNANILSLEMAQYLKQYIKEPFKAIGTLKTQGYFTLKDKLSKIKLQIFANQNNYISYLVIKELLNKPSLLNLEAEINSDNITLKELSLNENNPNMSTKIINITGQIVNSKKTLLKDLRIQIPNSLTAATNFLGGEEISLNSDITLNNTVEKPEISGVVKIFRYNIKNYLTSIQNADINFTKDNIKILIPNIIINDSKLNTIINIDPNFSKDNIIINSIQLNCLNLDLNNFLNLAEKFHTDKIPLEIKNGIATINKFKVLDLTAQDISSDFKLENKLLKIYNIKANAYGGNIAGNINYNILSNNMEIQVEGRNTDLKNSLYDLCKLKDNIEGVSDFSAAISLIVQEKYNNTIKSLTGKIDFNAYNGKMGSLGKFEYYLSAKNIFYHGLLNTTINRIVDVLKKDKTEQFKSANGKILFQNGYIITPGITTQGKNMSLYIEGRHNMISNESNIDIYGRISDEITNKLGSFGDITLSEILNGQTGQKNVQIQIIPAEIIGKIPQLYNHNNGKTNTFRVNIYGNLESLNAINSFDWIKADVKNTENTQNDDLPDFTDL